MESTNKIPDTENTNPDSVPFIVFESELTRMERHVRRLWIALLSMLLAVVLIVGGFLWYLSLYDYVSNETVTIDGADGIANYIGKDGNIYNGEDRGEAYPLAHDEERQE